jgi:sterol desaturase/sphingolipid hydroxylase (fatty acid hydroxylase superfamily)
MTRFDSAWGQFWLYNIIMFLRYWVISGGLHLIVWHWFRRGLAAHHIQKTSAPKASMRREIFWSMVAIPIFASTAFFMAWAFGLGWIKVDTGPVAAYGWGRAIGAFVLLLFMHDTYFYWIHVLMHTPWLYRRVHLVHHLSTNPSAYAAYSFHPFESVLEMLFFPLALLILPTMNFYVLVTFFTFDFFINAAAHSGLDYLPERLHKTWLGSWINTPTHHNWHHQRATGNYGFYTLFWDRMCGTLVQPGRITQTFTEKNQAPSTELPPAGRAAP